MESEDGCTVFHSLRGEVSIPEDGILSRPILSNDSVRIVLFGMSAGQELTEHTSSMEALLQILQGEAEVRLGGTTHRLTGGAFIHIPPRLPHSFKALQPLVLLLVLLRRPPAPE
ncbi:MAG: cupin domain-containing protein [Candidatus Hydrogenedentes bacterium]|nr:cupin domain-containing protein [Candidatus Hydrogenedentota bacterium]